MTSDNRAEAGGLTGPLVDPNRVTVSVAELRVETGDATLVTRGLGSCVALALYDEAAGIGGLGHFMLPDESEFNQSNDSKFVDTGTDRLVGELGAAGADPGRLTARIAGGASILDIGDTGIGERNVEAVRASLADHGIPLLGEDVGGEHSRTVELDAATGGVEIRSPAHETRSL
jgi:chemotaxis protein CheD